MKFDTQDNILEVTNNKTCTKMTNYMYKQGHEIVSILNFKIFFDLEFCISQAVNSFKTKIKKKKRMAQH